MAPNNNTNSSQAPSIQPPTIEKKSEVNYARERAEVRRKLIIQLLEHAATRSQNTEIQNMLKDPEKLNQILSVIVVQPDGSLRIVTQGVARLAGDAEAIDADIAGVLERAKLEVNEGARSFQSTLKKAVVDLKEASITEKNNIDPKDKISAVLTDANLRDIENLLQSASIDVLQKRNEAAVEAMRILYDAVGTMKQQKDIQAAFYGFISQPPFDVSTKNAILQIIKNEPNTVTEEQTSNVLNILRDAVRPSLSIDHAQRANLLTTIDKRISDLRFHQLDAMKNNATARRDLNHRLFGSSGELVVRYAMVARPDSKQELDFAMLAEQLNNLGVTVTVDKLVTASGPLQGTRERKYIVSDDSQLRPLIDYINSLPGFKNTPGISIDNLYNTATERMMLEKMSETVLQQAKRTDGFNLSAWKIPAELQKLEAFTEPFLPIPTGKNKDQVVNEVCAKITNDLIMNSLPASGFATSADAQEWFSISWGIRTTVSEFQAVHLKNKAKNGEFTIAAQGFVRLLLNGAYLSGEFVACDNLVKDTVDKGFNVNKDDVNSTLDIQAGSPKASDPTKALAVLLFEDFNTIDATNKNIDETFCRNLPSGSALNIQVLRNGRVYLNQCNDDAIIAASDLGQDLKVPENWNYKPLLAFLRLKRLEAKTGVLASSISKSTGERIKGYMDSLGSVGGVAFDKWLAWITSIPSEFTDKDGALNKLIKQEQALRSVRTALLALTDGEGDDQELDNFQKQYHDQIKDSNDEASLRKKILQEKNTQKKNDLEKKLRAVLLAKANLDRARRQKEERDELKTSKDRPFTDACERLRELQHSLNNARTMDEPSNRPDVQVPQLQKLLKASAMVHQGLQGTGYAFQKDRAIRNQAFYLALEDGVDAANLYLRDPQVAAPRPPDLQNNLDEYQKRYDANDLAAGSDVLMPMRQKFGLTMRPDALATLSTCTFNGCLLSVGKTRIDNWLTQPEHAGPALEQIIVRDPHTKMTDPEFTAKKKLFIQIFTSKKDAQDPKGTLIPFAEVYEMVSMMRDRLLYQQSDIQRNWSWSKEKANARSPLNALRGGVDVIKGMLAGDFVEKSLAVGLIVGSCWALHKMWKRGGLTKAAVWGVPMFFGLDVALRRATGQGVFDRLGLTYMNEKDRNAGLEQFTRRTSKIDAKYANLDSPAGRVAIRQLTHPEKRIPLQCLLEWRQKVRATGTGDPGTCAPAGLSPSQIVHELGTIVRYNKDHTTLKREAYQLLFNAFEAMCVDIAQSNGLHGSTINDKANNGAELLHKRYVAFNDPYLKDAGCDAQFRKCCLNVSMFEVMAWERPTPSMVDALENSTYLEWFAAKAGLSFDFVRRKLREGLSYTEIIALTHAQRLPDYYRTMRLGACRTFDAFMDWARPSWKQFSKEVAEDAAHTWKLMADCGIYLKDKAPGVAVFLRDTAIDAAEFSADKAVEIYRGLHNMQVTGNILEGFEKLCTESLKINIKQKDLEEMSKVAVLKQDLQKNLDAVTKTTNAGKTLEALIDGWMISAGIAEKDAATQKLKEKSATTPADRIVDQDVTEATSADMNTPQGRQQMLRVIYGTGATPEKITELRKKFNDGRVNVERKALNGNEVEYVDYLLGTSDNDGTKLIANSSHQCVQKKVLEHIKSAGDIASIANAKPLATLTTKEQERIQLLVDAAVTQVLKEVQGGNSPMPSEQESVALSKFASGRTKALSPDTTSLVLEYAMYKGDYSKVTLDQYNTYRKQQGLLELPTILPGWFDAWTLLAGRDLSYVPPAAGRFAAKKQITEAELKENLGKRIN